MHNIIPEDDQYMEEFTSTHQFDIHVARIAMFDAWLDSRLITVEQNKIIRGWYYEERQKLIDLVKKNA